MDLQQLVQFTIFGLNIGAIYALVALGFVAVFSITGIINFAQGEFAMLGAMIASWLVRVAEWPLPLAAVGAVAAVVGIAILLELGVIRPAGSASIVALIIITIGASVLLKGLAVMLWGPDPVRLPPFTSGPPIRVLGARLLPQDLWVLGTTAGVVVLLSLLFRGTLEGKAMRAVAMNRYAARLMGISARRVSTIAFALAGALGALGGIVIAPSTSAYWDMGTNLGLKGFVAAILGGMGAGGAVLGGLMLGVVEELCAGLAPSGYGGYKDAVAFIILLGVLFFRPRGLLGKGVGRGGL
jgi:branched-chain amino acid transport system permease protein